MHLRVPWLGSCSIPDGYNIGRDEFVNQSQKEKDGITSFFFTKCKRCGPPLAAK